MRVRLSPGDRQTTLPWVLWRVLRSSPSYASRSNPFHSPVWGITLDWMRLDEFGQHAAQIGRVQEGDGRAHGPVPRPLDRAAGCRSRRSRTAPRRCRRRRTRRGGCPRRAGPGTCPRRVRRQRLEQLNVPRASRQAARTDGAAWPRAPPVPRSPPGSPPRARTSPGTARWPGPDRGRRCRRDRGGSAAVAPYFLPDPLGIVDDMSDPRQPVIVGGARTPVGRLLGSLASKSASELGGVAIAGALERAGVAPGSGRVRDHGAGPAGGRRARSRPAGRGGGGYPDDGPGADGQQGLPVRPGRHRARRAADQAGRARRGRGRRDGVHDPGAAPSPELPGRLQVRPLRGPRLDGPRRPDRRVRSPVHGRIHREQRAQARHHPGRAGRVRGREPPARGRGGQERPVRRRDRRRARPAAERRGGAGDRGRGHPAGHDRRIAGQAPPRVRRGRYDHRRHRVADLRRCRRRRGDVGRSRRTRPG